LTVQVVKFQEVTKKFAFTRSVLEEFGFMMLYI